MPNAYDNKVLDGNGLLFYHTSLKSIFVEQESGKGLSTNDYTTTEKTKLSGIEAGATATTVDASFIASSTNPVQSAVIKSALDGKVDAVSGKGLSTEDYTTAEKTKLSGIEAGATATTVDASFVASSTNPVQSAVIKAALDGKVDVVSGKGLSTNDYTTAEKNKLAAFQDASNYALKTDVSGLYKYKGSVATYSQLPSSGQAVGDVWNVESDGMNYAWDGTDWDSLGASFSVAALSNEEIAAIIAAADS